ncbi:MAG: hypothetical protein HFI75_00170 [Lachnospiraceae bacterium]|nr:hypothetical protein [Lachnospiraceae bacterium]
MFRRNSSLSFAEKQTSVRGIFSAVLGMIALIICIGAVVISYMKKGSAGQLIGSCGIMALLSSIMGFLFGIGGLVEKGTGHILAGIGLGINTILSAGLVFLFVTSL